MSIHAGSPPDCADPILVGLGNLLPSNLLLISACPHRASRFHVVPVRAPLSGARPSDFGVGKQVIDSI